MNDKNFNIRVTTNDEPATQFDNRATSIPGKNTTVELKKVETEFTGVTASCKAILEDNSGFAPLFGKIDLISSTFILEIKRILFKEFYKKYVEEEGKLKSEANTDFDKVVNNSSVLNTINCLRNVIVTCIKCNEHINWAMVNIAKSNFILSINLLGYDINGDEIYVFVNTFVKMIEGCKILAN